MKRYNTLICLCSLSLLLSCGNKESSNESLDELYQIFEIIQKECSVEEIQEFKSMDEEEAIHKHYRFGLGIWLRNNYLKSESGLFLFFQSHGIITREDMSDIILTSFHRKLNNLPLKFDEQVEDYKKYYREHVNEVEEHKDF